MSLIFFILAAICNAVMDTLSHHYSTSVFTSYDPKYWNPKYSWKNKYVDWDGGNRKMRPMFWILDAWHLFKSCMIVFLCLSVVTFPMMYVVCPWWFGMALYVGVYGLLWNITFSAFYHRFFIR